MVKKVIADWKLAKEEDMFLPRMDKDAYFNMQCRQCPLKNEDTAKAIGKEQCPMHKISQVKLVEAKVNGIVNI